MWGRAVPVKDYRGPFWGARAIYTNGYIDLLPDRQRACEDDVPGKDEFFDWLNDEGLAEFQGVIDDCKPCQSSTSVFTYESDDGKYAVEGSPQGSHGYMYIVAWQQEGVPVDTP